MMKKRVLSLALAALMVISSMVVTSLPAVAEDAETPTYTAPEIVVKGEVDVWDKKTYTDPSVVRDDKPVVTDDDGYILITSAAEMAWFFKNIRLTAEGETPKNYRLTTNVDLQNVAFTRDDNRSFDGIFDGAGYAILNLKSQMAGYSGAGYLFNTVTGTIKDLVIDGYTMPKATNSRNAFIYSLSGGKVINVDIYGLNVSDCCLAAGIANAMSNGALVEDCLVTGSFSTSGNAGEVGGVVGAISDADSIIRDCTSYVDITSVNYVKVGGIVGSIKYSSATVENCTNYGNIKYTGAHKSAGTNEGNGAGGIIGYLCGTYVSGQPADFKVSGCLNYGSITAEKANAGGIAGAMDCQDGQGNSHRNKWSGGVTTTFEDCVNYGTITAGVDEGTLKIAAGGFAGWSVRKLYVTNCANYGVITAKGSTVYAGGIAGRLTGRHNAYATDQRTGATLTNVACYGTVTSSYAGGAVAGYYDAGSNDNETGYFIYNSAVVVDVSAPYAGHLVGYAYTNYSNNKFKMTIDGSVFAGTITSTGDAAAATPNYYPGILAGYLTHAKKVTVTVDATSYINESGLTTLFDYAGTAHTPAEYATYTPAAYSTEAIVSEKTLTAFNSFAEANEYSTWYMSGTKKAPVPVSQLQLTRATVMVADQIFVVAQAEDILALPQGMILEIRDDEGNVIVGELAESGTYQFVLSGVSLDDIAETKNYTMIAGGTEAEVSYSFSVIDLLADLYNDGNTSPNEQALIVSMVNFAYCAGHATAFEDFNAKANTALEPLSLADVAPLEDAGDLFTTEGYTIALDMANGLTVVAYDADGNAVKTVTKSVFNIYDIVDMGVAGQTTIAAMLNAYLANAQTHDLAAAAILYCLAAAEVQP